MIGRQVESSSVDPVTIIIRECINMSSAMRKYSKLSSQTGITALLAGGGDIIHNQDELSTNKFNSLSTHKNNDPFLLGFIQLRLMLNKLDTLNDVDSLTVLQPFLLVVSTNTISGYITSLALDSLQKFINLNIIDQHSKNYVNAYRGLINALTHCRFQSSDQISDDSVLLKVVMLLNSIINLPSQICDCLSDSIMYDVIQTTLSLACNKRRADVLKKAAESTMISITLKVFGKLRTAEPANLLQQYINDESYSKDNLKDDVIGTGIANELQSIESLTLQQQESINNSVGDAEDPMSDIKENNNQFSDSESHVVNIENLSNTESDQVVLDRSTKQDNTNIEGNHTFESNYGVTVARQYLTLLLSLILPENQTKHTNSTKIFSLQLLTTIIEFAGDKLPLYPRLFSLVADPIFKSILFIIQTNSKLSLLQATLQLFTTLVAVLGNYLPMQIELTLSRIFAIMLGGNHDITEDNTSGSSSSNKNNNNGSGNSNSNIKTTKSMSIFTNQIPDSSEAAKKELLIEQISILWLRSSSFFISMFVSFDCDLNRADLALGFLKMLTKLSLPEAAITSTEIVPPICLEGVMSLIDDMFARIRSVPESVSTNDLKQNEVLRQRERKNEFINCANEFNIKPKKGIPLLIEKKFIENNTDNAIAKFLFENNGRLNKKTIGLLLCDPKKTLLLKEFINLFNFRGLRVDEAIRVLLTKFRLPGESQQIERIIEAFSIAYAKSQDNKGGNEIIDNRAEETNLDTTNTEANIKEENNEEYDPVIPDSDSVFVLSYSIIMLNTDLHNPQVKEHMSFDEYSSNLRGCYNSKDFPHWYLDKIYCSIRDKEIVMPEEHHGNDKWFEDAWNNLIASTTVMTKIQKDNVDVIDKFSPIDLLGFDRTIFKHVGPSIVNTLLKIFVVASDDHVAGRVLTCLDKCAFVAEFFKNKKLYNNILDTIAKFTTVLGPNSYIKEAHDNSYFNYEDNIPLVEITVDEKTKIPVSNLSVRLGKSLKSRLCCLMFFRILQRTRNGSIISSELWDNIISILKQLFENLLLSPDIFTDLQEKLKLGHLPKPQPDISINKSIENRGLLSTFASYLKGDEEPTEEEVDYSKRALEYINKSNVAASIVGNENIITPGFIKSLLESLNEKKDENNLKYFEAELLFITELIVALTLFCKDEKELSNIILDKLRIMIKMSGVTKRTIRRLLMYEILLISVINGQENRISTLIKDQLLGMPEIFNEKYFSTKQGEELIRRVLSLTDIANYRQHILKDEYFWRFLRWLASMPIHTKTTYNYVKDLFEANKNSIISQNDVFMFVLGLLDEISSIGAVGSRWELEYNKSVESGHKVSSNNPYQNIVEISLKSINMTATLIENRNLSKNEMVAIIQALVHQCMNPCEQIRSYAVSSLESSLTERIQLSKPKLNSDSNIGGELIKFEDIINIGIVSIINMKTNDQKKETDVINNIGDDGALEVPITTLLSVISKAYLYHLEKGTVTNETFVYILNVFNGYVDNPKIETQLQELILKKKRIEKNGATTMKQLNSISMLKEEDDENEKAKEQADEARNMNQE
ncbi:Arf family guanine nucleotide exchange factor GEA2 PWA37_000004 [Arxiozyma heterogenica]|uniref:Arf family guanine nucleotide exchange factor GEA2 n=1 Tax=Arxiozyma heterogenica TaxID=278026 RepID=UPI002EFFAE77